MLNKEERLRALKANLSGWPWDISPAFKIEKEDAPIILEALALLADKEQTDE